jgi:hypothetical protein
MELSTKCFNLDEINATISSSQKIGTCDVTGSENVNIIDVEDIANFFIELLSVYNTDSNGKPLAKILQEDWNVFTSDDIAFTVLNEICKIAQNGMSSETLVCYSDDILSSVREWDEIKGKLKWEQRYFTGRLISDEMKWDVYLSPNDIIEEGSLFYRGRLNIDEDECIKDLASMGAPPQEKATAGRANPPGIPFLYLTQRENTTMYETRALFGDKLSIGQFKITREMNILNFNKRPNLYVNYSQSEYDSMEDAIRGYFLRRNISRDLSKPMRRYDNKEIEYIPTQFICEYVKTISGADGIQFDSSLHKGGVNVVLFDINSAQCERVSVKEIGKYSLKFK